MDKKHIVMYSAGAGSDASARRVIEQHGKENIIFLFSDTLVEDKYAYRFMIQSIMQMMGLPEDIGLLDKCGEIPDIKSDQDIKVRKTLLPQIAVELMHRIPQVKWLIDGRTPWDIFFKKRFLGNSRLAQCSHILKQDTADRWIKSTFSPDEVILYIGIDWTEMHRMAAPTKNWSPYEVRFPMTEAPYLSKEDMLQNLQSLDIDVPRLYSSGFSHNNCAGGCVRGGQAHWKNLLLQDRDQYLYHERKEEEMQNMLGKPVTILKREVSKNKKKVVLPLSLKDHRLNIEANGRIDELDFGGCGCFVSE